MKIPIRVQKLRAKNKSLKDKKRTLAKEVKKLDIEIGKNSKEMERILRKIFLKG